jgi:uncharacterized membrane protein YqjE
VRDDGNESLPALVGSVVSDVTDIVKAELQLAVVEMREDARKLARTVPIAASGFVLATAGLGFSLLTIMLALNVVLPAWAAAGIVALALLLVAVGVLIPTVRKLADRRSYVPERSLKALKETREWMRQRTN